MKTAIFAAGCFWGVQYHFEKVPGVIDTIVGYIGGDEENPTYAEVKTHQTHHVEAIKVDYDETIVPYTGLCKLFYEIHNPAQTDGIGPDIGPQYKSVIFYIDEQQKADAEHVTNLLKSKGYEVNTEIRPATKFWNAEEYHQHYYDKTHLQPYCHILEHKF